MINTIFANIFTGLITDAFGENREKAWSNEIDKEERCFICQITKSECINSHIDFNDHREDHSVWKYIYFVALFLVWVLFQSNKIFLIFPGNLKKLNFQLFLEHFS